jgi:hypothetical protein
MTDGWLSETKTGDHRPVCRATVHVTRMRRFSYDTSNAVGGNLEYDRPRRGNFSTIIFGDDTGGVEIRNIKSINWSRSKNADVQEMTLVLKNTDLTPIGNQEELAHADDFDQPGIMTPTRGESPIGPLGPNPWGYDGPTGWEGRLAPDRIVKTYEGYGTDATAVPADDPYLVQSGTWIIDEVTLNNAGDIELRCRDVGRLLLDQIAIPPVIPYEEYPLSWTTIHTVTDFNGRIAQGGDWKFLRAKDGTADSSNSKYIGNPDAPGNYVGANGGVQGHHHSDVLSGDDGAYWLSTGQTSPWSVVWWEIDLNDKIPLNAIRFTPHGGPYRVYISLHTTKGWIGRREVPYDVTTLGVDVDADIPFVWTDIAEKGRPLEATLKKVYGGVDKIRLTFTKLNDTERANYPFNAGLREVEVYTAATKGALSFGRGEKTKTVGNYSDYTDIVKWACAWGGFYWPTPDTGMDFIAWGDQKHYFNQVSGDWKVLPKGRVWGDFMNAGVAGVHPGGDLTVDLFDKQPLMNIINYVRDILGFIFFVDETGGIIWRMPNVEKLGNYLAPDDDNIRSRARTTDIIELHEGEHIQEYSVTLNGRNQRERIFVGDANGKKGVAIKGFTAYNVGYRRIAGWTDQNFESYREMRVMADMIATQQMFDYRRSRIRIDGYPAIQVDDQIRVYERVTNETFLQYVETVSSSLDMENGRWTYELETHWLGEDPDGTWVMKTEKLDEVTRNYLNALGTGES